ncbi:hypothetical protein CEXT_319181 [Caerostris extrusa]|uniref:Uncharacterized protein n=1 Tax=Caerostris extrusa TaxID=172846 RepID=A0AAV4QJU3_CAEEX|nr:hypothetical protein CEXT_319181 [Caerostris extrusa]
MSQLLGSSPVRIRKNKKIKNCISSKWEEYLASITAYHQHRLYRQRNPPLAIKRLLYLKITSTGEDFQQYFPLKAKKDIKPFPKKNVRRID